MQSLINRRKKIVKFSDQLLLDEFSTCPFVAPVPRIANKKPKEVSRQLENSSFINEVNENLCSEVESLKIEDERKEKELKQFSQKLGDLQKKKIEAPSRSRQNMKRKAEIIVKKKEIIKKLKKGSNISTSTTTDIQLNHLKKQKTNMAAYYQSKKRNVSKSSLAVKDSELSQLRNFLSRYENVQLKTEISELRSGKIQTKKDDKTYSDDLRETIYALSNLNVSSKNIANVIKSVLNCKTKKDIDTLPDHTTINRIIREMKQLSTFQVAEQISMSKYMTCKYDGTQKRGEHFVEVSCHPCSDFYYWTIRAGINNCR